MSRIGISALRQTNDLRFTWFSSVLQAKYLDNISMSSFTIIFAA